ncbi:MAG: biopolymer transporter ExbD [Bacteroidales bacterium]|jgi:biopolymer transport protein ExbD|nr:biopolymer transporter ExbD [Bacteroidales bacterium]MDD2264381.1 biopolymer transporter ExbD [Bacteroidales bacterium]MDD2831615.1 biopolymer transporter ExbD [Bacteroidales bacterium]MDD3209180.1 biopolymer transporter ExbD [Bacteroidales bacterium]MDD3697535.1 biopolymer transporter ExbD [Bacteroidales bacterium]
MAKFKTKTGKELKPLNTASLPDIVFMLLFFFMISVSFRQTERVVTIKLPEATEIAKLDRKDLASYINIGTPIPALQSQYGTEARIQLNDSFSTIDDIRDFIAASRESMSEADRPLMTVSLKVDENVRMGIITDVKQELRRCSALRIMYSTRRKSEQHNF